MAQARSQGPVQDPAALVVVCANQSGSGGLEMAKSFERLQCIVDQLADQDRRGRAFLNRQQGGK